LVKSMRSGLDYTNERMGGRPQAQENRSKMIQAKKTLELRIEVLVDAMTGCHMAVATRKTRKEIEASMDAVEIAWDKIGRTRVEFGSDAGLNFDHLPMMVEMVLRKATKYLAKAQAKMEKWWEAQVQALEAEKATEVSEMNEVAPEVSEMNEVAPEVSEMNKVAPEVSEMNKVAPEVSAVNEVALEVSAVNEVAPEVSAVNKVNEVAPEESTVIKDSDEVCDVKEDMSKGKSLEIEAKVEVKEESEEVVTAKPDDVLLRFDSTAKVQVEEFGMKEVMQIDDLKMKKESRHASWDPGEPVSDKAQTEMLDAKEEKILVSNDKVELTLGKKEARPRGDVNANVLSDAMLLFNFMELYISEVLVPVARNAARFVDVNPLSSRCFAESFLPILSDYG